MTRLEALVKLLAVGELTEPEAWVICGWPREEFSKVLRDALESKLIIRLEIRLYMFSLDVKLLSR